MEEKKELLLKQYETCQQDNQNQTTRYWTILGLFISINTPIIGGLAVLSNTSFINLLSIISNLSTYFIVMFISLAGILVITRFLDLSLNRIYSIIQNNTRYMIAIEIELGLRKELPIYVLDKWDKVRKKLKYKTNPCENQNAKIWEAVWKELYEELSKDDFVSICNDKAKIENISYQKRTYSSPMYSKISYVFWGVFSLWAVLIAYILVLSYFKQFGYWSFLAYGIVGTPIALDYRNIKKREYLK